MRDTEGEIQRGGSVLKIKPAFPKAQPTLETKLKFPQIGSKGISSEEKGLPLLLLGCEEWMGKTSLKIPTLRDS